MKALRLILMVFVPAMISAAMFFVFNYPSLYFYAAVISFAVQDVMLFVLFPRQERNFDVVSITFPIVLHTLLAWAILFFIEDPFLLYAVAIGQGVLQYIFLGNVYYFLYKFEKYQKRALPHITSYVGIVNVFYAAGIVYALGFYMDVPIWYMAGPFLFLMFCMIAQNMWIHDISVRQKWYYLAITLLVMAQLLFVVHLLPSVYFANAFWLMVYYYIAVHIGISALQKELTRTEYIRNSIIIAIVVFLVLLTTRWR